MHPTLAEGRAQNSASETAASKTNFSGTVDAPTKMPTHNSAKEYRCDTMQGNRDPYSGREK